MDFYDYNLMEFLRASEIGEISISKQQLVNIVMDVSDALAYIHDEGYVHRDIKPENILIYKDGQGRFRAAIGDFGLCRRLNDETTLKRAGTRFYFDYPEKHATTSSDMWAFGITAFEIFALFHPVRREQKLDPKRHGRLDIFLKKLQEGSEISVRTFIGMSIGGARSYRKLKRVIHDCLQVNPLSRLKAADISMQLGRDPSIPTILFSA